MTQKDKNLIWHNHSIQKQNRQKRNQHKSFIIWLTGMSGAGKSTIANALEKELFHRGLNTYLLDGDNVRQGLNKDLGFSVSDREENIRRIAEVAKLFVDAGLVVITAFISPFQKDRELARSLVDQEEFVEVYIKCPLEKCEERDPKGLYQKARAGLIQNFTGIDSPYEEPSSPDLVLDTCQFSAEECVENLIQFLEKEKQLSPLD